MDDPAIITALNEAFRDMDPAVCWREFQALPTEVRTDLLDVAYWAAGIDAPGPATGRKVRRADGIFSALLFSIGDPSLVEKDGDGSYVLLDAAQAERMDRLVAVLGPIGTMVLIVFAMGVVTAASKDRGR